jgi:hypothetical protein
LLVAVEFAQDAMGGGLALEADAGSVGESDPAVAEHGFVGASAGGLELARVGLVAAELEGCSAVDLPDLDDLHFFHGIARATTLTEAARQWRVSTPIRPSPAFHGHSVDLNHICIVGFGQERPCSCVPEPCPDGGGFDCVSPVRSFVARWTRCGPWRARLG